MIIRKQSVKINDEIKNGYFFTEEELFSFTNECMQEKAKYDGTNFTPTYEVQEFLRKIERGYIKRH